MDGPQYEYAPPELAFRKAQFVELVPHPEILRGNPRLDAQLAMIDDATDELIANWEERSSVAFDTVLHHLAEFSEDQLNRLHVLFAGAGVELAGMDPPPPVQSSFAWASVTRAAVLALLDTLVDSGSLTLGDHDWADSTDEHLERDDFTRATGINQSDHQTVLRLAAESFFPGPEGRMVVQYRGRFAGLECPAGANKVEVTMIDLSQVGRSEVSTSLDTWNEQDAQSPLRALISRILRLGQSEGPRTGTTV